MYQDYFYYLLDAGDDLCTVKSNLESEVFHCKHGLKPLGTFAIPSQDLKNFDSVEAYREEYPYVCDTVIEYASGPSDGVRWPGEYRDKSLREAMAKAAKVVEAKFPMWEQGSWLDPVTMAKPFMDKYDAKSNCAPDPAVVRESIREHRARTAITGPSYTATLPGAVTPVSLETAIGEGLDNLVPIMCGSRNDGESDEAFRSRLRKIILDQE